MGEVAADEQEEGQHDRRVEIGAGAGEAGLADRDGAAIRIAMEIGTSMSRRRARKRAEGRGEERHRREGDGGQRDRGGDPVQQVAGGVGGARPHGDREQHDVHAGEAGDADAGQKVAPLGIDARRLERGAVEGAGLEAGGDEGGDQPLLGAGVSSTVAAARFSVRLTRAATTPSAARSARSTPAMQAAQWIEGSDSSIRRSASDAARRGAGGGQRGRGGAGGAGGEGDVAHGGCTAGGRGSGGRRAVGRRRDDLGAPAAGGEVGGGGVAGRGFLQDEHASSRVVVGRPSVTASGGGRTGWPAASAIEGGGRRPRGRCRPSSRAPLGGAVAVEALARHVAVRHDEAREGVDGHHRQHDVGDRA